MKLPNYPITKLPNSYESLKSIITGFDRNQFVLYPT
jgi:hypothetical protein